MELSKTEILVLEQVSRGNKTVKGIAKALGKSDKQVYVTVARLAGKDIVQRTEGAVQPIRSHHVTLLLQQLARTPNLAPMLSNSGISVLSSVLRPATMMEIERKTGLRKTIVYKKLSQGRKRSLVRKEGQSFQLNRKMWPLMWDLMEETVKYEEAVDIRIPAGSVVYRRKDGGIVFSCREETDAAKTAFSAYGEYGIKLHTNTNYYCLPKRQLTKQDVLKHSLYVIEKEWSVTNVTYLALFYAKFRKEFTARSAILDNLDVILRGGKVDGYPSYAEIAEKAGDYGIKI